MRFLNPNLLGRINIAVCLSVASMFFGCGRQEISANTAFPPGEDIPILSEDIENEAPQTPETIDNSADATAVVVTEKAADKLLLADDNQVQCPSGSSFVSASRLCKTPNNRAVGPFTSAMVADCEKYGGGKACKSESWEYKFAVSLRGNKVCAKGAAHNAALNICVEGAHAFGPFTKSAIARCLENKGSAAVCSSMRIAASLLKATVSQPMPGSVNRKLFDYYSQSANYKKVYNNVMGWYGTKTNGCVAFMSTALRQVGVSVPQNGNLGGDPISLVTLPFSRYLSEKLGWKKITKAADLQPGDIVFTVDAPGWPGYPWHTYMFHSWVDKENGTGRVIDNQAFTHNRNIFGYGSYNFSPFAYALRAPN